MYKQFCKNFENFLKINKSQGYRYKIANEIKVLTDVDTYLKLKEKKHNKYKEISNFIFEVSQYKNQYPDIDKFIWELWGYGFDIEKYDGLNTKLNNKIDEKVKLIDLLLSTHYWT
ncbi:hypothetical protein [Clostridiisalibacter paucivorans]|uniref:hypothetical protein n=1 Tax=Clostridiisalibacter paucivorans TaxID=408753 RepID=UPI00047882A6|nr:hypothetical protein [Clostridiisalibacter paucivorans]